MSHDSHVTCTYSGASLSHNTRLRTNITHQSVPGTKYYFIIISKPNPSPPSFSTTRMQQTFGTVKKTANKKKIKLRNASTAGMAKWKKRTTATKGIYEGYLIVTLAFVAPWTLTVVFNPSGRSLTVVHVTAGVPRVVLILIEEKTVEPRG